MLHSVSVHVASCFESGTFVLNCLVIFSSHVWFEVLSGDVHGHAWVLLGVLHQSCFVTQKP
eukprot:Gb_40178 [translate_table: standard]